MNIADIKCSFCDGKIFEIGNGFGNGNGSAFICIECIDKMHKIGHRQDKPAPTPADKPEAVEAVDEIAKAIGATSAEIGRTISDLADGLNAVLNHDCGKCPIYDDCPSSSKTPRGQKIN